MKVARGACRQESDQRRGGEDAEWKRLEVRETYHLFQTNKSCDAVCYEDRTHTLQQKPETI